MTPETDKRCCEPGPERGEQPILQSLIPIAVVIAAGCEACAEKMVRRALGEGSSRGQVLKAIEIVEHLHGSECFQTAISQDVRERMVKPLARARQVALEEPGKGMAGSGRSCC